MNSIPTNVRRFTDSAELRTRMGDIRSLWDESERRRREARAVGRQSQLLLAIVQGINERESRHPR